MATVEVNGAHCMKEKNLFYPEHLADLKSSGISVETATAARLRSVAGDELTELLGFTLPSGTTGLLFPYEEDFLRAKLFPPLVNKNSTMKYAQPQNSGVRLYVPPATRGVLKNPTIQLVITEGEKKSLKADQEEIPCLGVGGLWNWLHDGQPIPDLDSIAWVERPVVITPDSDVWSRPDLMRAVYALGAELEGRGARVSACIIPQQEDEKLGLDDFLVAHGRTAFDSLQRVNLKHKCFAEAGNWHKGWIERKRNEHHSPEALQLLKSIKQVRFIHPAQDFVGGILWYGIPAEKNVILVNSNREPLRSDQLPGNLELANRGFDLSRFSPEGINRFIAGATQSGQELVGELSEYFQRHVIIKDRHIYRLLSIWVMGTYVYMVFRVFPYLSLRSPTKECGKSRTEDLLSLVCFNASQRETSPTEAALFRGPGKNGGTVLLDEIESLKHDRDRFGNLLAVLNSGFERGGNVTRIEKRGNRFVDVSYPTYCPRVLAGINRLAETLEGRAITIYLERKLRSEKVARFSRARHFDAMQETRDRLHIWALTHAPDLARVYEAIHEFSALDGLPDRERDLWEPLVSTALLCDSEYETEKRPLTDELCALAHKLSKVRVEIDSANVTQILNVLEGVLDGKQEVKISPTELLNRFKENPYFEWLKSAKSLAGLLAPLGLTSSTHRYPETGRPTRLYQIKRAVIDDRKERYGGGE